MTGFLIGRARFEVARQAALRRPEGRHEGAVLPVSRRVDIVVIRSCLRP